jgi:hypothetical protein
MTSYFGNILPSNLISSSNADLFNAAAVAAVSNAVMTTPTTTSTNNNNTQIQQQQHINNALNGLTNITNNIDHLHQYEDNFSNSRYTSSNISSYERKLLNGVAPSTTPSSSSSSSVTSNLTQGTSFNSIMYNNGNTNVNYLQQLNPHQQLQQQQIQQQNTQFPLSQSPDSYMNSYKTSNVAEMSMVAAALNNNNPQHHVYHSQQSHLINNHNIHNAAAYAAAAAAAVSTIPNAVGNGNPHQMPPPTSMQNLIYPWMRPASGVNKSTNNNNNNINCNNSNNSTNNSSKYF